MRPLPMLFADPARRARQVAAERLSLTSRAKIAACPLGSLALLPLGCTPRGRDAVRVFAHPVPMSSP